MTKIVLRKNNTGRAVLEHKRKFYAAPSKHSGIFTKKVAGAEADRIAYWRSTHDRETFIRIMKQQGCV